MKSVTLAVIFAGLMSYGTIYTNTAVPSHGPESPAFAITHQPLNSDPDDDEDEHRVKTRNRMSNPQNRRTEN